MIIVSVFYHLFCLCAQKTKSEECGPHVYLNGVYIPLFFYCFCFRSVCTVTQVVDKARSFGFQSILAGDFVMAMASIALARIKNADVVSVVAKITEDLVRGR